MKITHPVTTTNGNYPSCYNNQWNLSIVLQQPMKFTHRITTTNKNANNGRFGVIELWMKNASRTMPFKLWFYIFVYTFNFVKYDLLFIYLEEKPRIVYLIILLLHHELPEDNYLHSNIYIHPSIKFAFDL